eukprot:jgi/Chlat1/5533/Chrsp369S05397
MGKNTEDERNAAEARDADVNDEQQEEEEDEGYRRWRAVIPLLYDWLSNHHLVWPSLSCRWGPVIATHTYKTTQRAYLSEQTDGSVPNTLVVANVEVVKPRVAASDHIRSFDERDRSQHVKKHKTIFHPGEVNRIRECPHAASLVATHTDAPEVYIWNVDTQPECKLTSNPTASRPDLVLSGHEANAEFALSLSKVAPSVISGGKDRNVLMWSLTDHVTSLLAHPSTSASDTTPSAAAGSGRSSWNSGGGTTSTAPPAPTVEPRQKFTGHTDTVEDIQFHPSSAEECCSVGDDYQLLFWDARSGGAPVLAVKDAHKSDLHCVDWNAHNEHLVLTGSADSTVRLFDRRKLSTTSNGAAAVHIFSGHKEPITTVQWSPDKATVFASGGEDHFVNIWDTSRTGSKVDSKTEGKGGPPVELIFQHAGHKGPVQDFNWNPASPWSILSVSQNEDIAGGTLQMWRVNDFVYKTEEELLPDLERFRDEVLGKTQKAQVNGNKPAEAKTLVQKQPIDSKTEPQTVRVIKPSSDREAGSTEVKLNKRSDKQPVPSEEPVAERDISQPVTQSKSSDSKPKQTVQEIQSLSDKAGAAEVELEKSSGEQPVPSAFGEQVAERDTSQPVTQSETPPLPSIETRPETDAQLAMQEASPQVDNAADAKPESMDLAKARLETDARPATQEATPQVDNAADVKPESMDSAEAQPETDARLETQEATPQVDNTANARPESMNAQPQEQQEATPQEPADVNTDVMDTEQSEQETAEDSAVAVDAKAELMDSQAEDGPATQQADVPAESASAGETVQPESAAPALEAVQEAPAAPDDDAIAVPEGEGEGLKGAAAEGAEGAADAQDEHEDKPTSMDKQGDTVMAAADELVDTDDRTGALYGDAQ